MPDENGSHNLRIVTSSDNPNWRTDPALFAALGEVLPFTLGLDLAATYADKLCDHYLSPEMDGGTIAQGPEGVISRMLEGVQGVYRAGEYPNLEFAWLNPPYSVKRYRETRDPAMLVESWAALCFRTAEMFADLLPNAKIVGLFPYTPQTEWWRTYVEGHGPRFPTFGAEAIWRFPHRLSFYREDGSGQAASSNVNHALVFWGSGKGFTGPWFAPTRYWTYR